MTQIQVYWNPHKKCWHAWFEGRNEHEPNVDRDFGTFGHFCEVAKMYARGESVKEE